MVDLNGGFVVQPRWDVRHQNGATLSEYRLQRVRFPPPPLANVYSIRYTNAMAATVPVRELRSELAHFIDRVADLREHVIVTRRGRPAAVLVPIDEYDALEETAEILSDDKTLGAIEEGLRQIERGETMTLAELRRDIADRRRIQ